LATSKKIIPKRDFMLHMSLALALGWSEIVINGGALLGRPPGGSPHSRDQALIPNWLGDFNACMTLALSYGIYPDKAMAVAEREDGLDNAQALRRGLCRTLLSALTITSRINRFLAQAEHQYHLYEQSNRKGEGVQNQGTRSQ
jgi:hypothetical protein